MKKLIFKLILLLLFIYSMLASIGVTNAATIYSTTSGGYWSSTSTWSGGVVPGQNDDVIIRGQVIIENQNVNNINIQSGASLTNHVAWGSTSYSALLDIKGNLVNNGNIFTSNDQSWYNDYLNIKVNGNIENNGTITNNSLTIYGNSKTITGNPINIQVIIGDNIELLGNTEINGNLTFNAGKNLTINSPYILKLNNGGVSSNSGAGILGNGEVNIGGGNQSISGEMTIGKLRFSGSGSTKTISNLIINGDLIVENGVKVTNYAPTGQYTGILDIKGGLENNGEIFRSTYSTEDFFNLYLKGDINNNGIWNVTNNYLYGTNSKNYFTSSGTSILGNNTLNDNFEITGESKFSGNYNFNGKTLTINSGNILTLGGISGTGNISGSGGKIYSNGGYSAEIGGSLYEFKFLSNGSFGLNGNLKTQILTISSGATIITYQATVDGDIINNGNLTNNAPTLEYIGLLDIKGNLNNNGNIYRNTYSNEDFFNIKVKGNISNSGAIGNNKVEIYGNNKTITGNPINSQVIVGDNIELLGNVEINGNLAFNSGKNLTINYPNILKLNNGSVGTSSGAGIIGNGEVNLSGNYQNIGGEITIGKLRFSGSGSTKIITNFILNGDLVIENGVKVTNYTPTLEYTGVLDVKGLIENYGEIFRSTYSNVDYFDLKLKGDINNNGIWNVTNNYLYGTNSKNYFMSPGSSILGNNISNDNFEITGLPKFSGWLNLNGKTLTLSGNILTLGGLSGTGNIAGSGGSIYLNGGYSAQIGGTLKELRFIPSGTYGLNGSLKADKLNILSGATINTSQFTIDGNIINNGNLTNETPVGSYIGILDIKGNLINNGSIYKSSYSTPDDFYVKAYSNIQNNGSITSIFYLKWPVVSGALNYLVNITGQSGATVSTNEYAVPSGTLVSGSKLWYVTGNGVNTPKKCINVPGCINSSGGSNQISPIIVDNNLYEYYNASLITAENISTGPKFLSTSSSDIKNKKNESVTTISENTSLGDPVNLYTGEFDYDNTLMSYNSEGFPFEFNIKYKNKAYYNGPLGNKFDYNYNIYLTEDGSGNIDYHDGKLGGFRFTKTSTGFLYNDTLNATLTSSGLNYIIKFDNQKTYTFGLNAKIEKIKDAFGNTMSFTYNDNKELTKITDTLGREYLVSYYSHSRIKDITDFTGNKVEFTYFSTGNTLGNEYDLEKITLNNSGSTRDISFTYTTGSTYENSHNIIKLIDSAGNTYVENTYDSGSRVLTQKYGSGTISYDYTLDENDNVTKNIVTDREGNVVEYYYDEKGNTTKKIIKKDSGDVEYNYVYDERSNLIKEIKPLGNGVEYTYDENNNITQTRVKANMSSSGSSNDIIITTTYDLRFNKPTQIISPRELITNLTYDNNGNLLTKEILGVKDYENNSLTITGSYQYNSKGQLIKEINAKGLETTFEYSSGNLVKIKKGTGSTAIENRFEYDEKGNMVKNIDGLGKETLITYDEFNLVIKKLTPELIENQYTYNNLNKKTNEKIILGSGSYLNTDYEYDILDNITKIIKDYDNNKSLEKTTVYDLNSRIIEEKLGSGATVKYTYDENGLLLQKKIESGVGVNGDITTIYAYDLNERLVSETNPRGKVTTYNYDLYDRIIKKTLPDGTYENYSYDKDSNLTIKEVVDDNTNTLLSKEENIYDKRGKVIGNKKYLLNGSGTINTYSKYDKNGNIIESVDAKGNENTFNYDIFDRLIETEDSLGNKITYTYDKNNNLVSKSIVQSNSKTNTTTYTYDDDNRLISETNELNKTKTYTYNNLNQIISITDEEGNVVNYTYDYLGNVLSEEKVLSSGNITTSYTYDERGNMLSVTDGEGNISFYEYDNLNRLIKQTYPDNKFITFSYDKNNNLISKTDPNGTTVSNTYDDLDRLVSKSINTGSGVLGVTSETYTYDSLGRLVSGNDSNNHELIFNYDSLNRLVSENQSGSVVSYTYDNNSNLLSITNPSNNSINYSYDELNRVTNIKKNSSDIANYTYSGIENTSVNYGNGINISKTYDDLSRILTLNNGIKNYSYSYDDVSNIIGDSYKNYSYDDIYRLIGTSNSSGSLETLSYDKVGNRVNNFNSYIGSGANYEYGVNNLNQYITLSGSIQKYIIEEIIEELEGGGGDNLFDEDFENESGSGSENSGSGETNSGSGENNNDSGGSENEDKESNSGSLNEESGSGSENETGTGEELSYTPLLRFANGQEESGSGLISYSGGLVNIDDSTTYIYDNNGNIINNGKYKFIYDYKNRIVEVTDQDDETIVEYYYDVLDRRYKKIISHSELDSESIQYTFSNENILEENITYSGSSSITKEYINGLGTDNLIAYDIGSDRYYFSKNHLGSVDGITDDSGVILIAYEYDSYGNTFVNNSGNLIDIQEFEGDTFENDRLYTGREFDNEINLYYLRARYYDSKIGRFISRDPIDITDDVNLYSYVGNKPVSFVDLMGKEKALIKIIDIFNSYGSFYNNLNKINIINSDYSIDINLLFGYDIISSKNANLKAREDLLLISDNGYIKTEKGNIHLSEFGNILYGYLGKKAGFSYEHIENFAYVETYNLKYPTGTEEERIEKSLNNEIGDRELYKIGYKLGEKKGKITKDDLLNLMSDIKYARGLEK